MQTFKIKFNKNYQKILIHMILFLQSNFSKLKYKFFKK